MKKHVKYDPRLQAVSDALEQVEAPRECCTMGTHTSYPPPGLVVDGVGDIALPLTETTAKALISASHFAPIGHGEHTLVDTQVRNTWELPTSQFKIENPAFDSFVKDQIAEACRGPLGIHETVVFEAKLYKLLLYETGGKFERHQDSEKENGMFGTLVVVLPGRFEGGELVVHHPSAADESKKTVLEGVPLTDVCVFDAGVMDPFSLKYVAFYGDCPHEVKPVTKGYRLCLTYDLIASSEALAGILDPQIGSNHASYATLEDALGEFFRSDMGDQVARSLYKPRRTIAPVVFDVKNPDTYRGCKLVYVLAHEYTRTELRTATLKGQDASVAANLSQFCDSSDGALDMYLCRIQYVFKWEGRQGTMYHSEEDEDSKKNHRTKCHIEGDESDVDDDDDPPRIECGLRLMPPLVQRNNVNTISVEVGRKFEAFDYAALDSTVTPCGIFDRTGIEFDIQDSAEYASNNRAYCTRWYGAAALIVAPLYVVAKWCIQRNNPSTVLSTWFELANSKPAHALAIARAFEGFNSDWSTTSELGARILETAAKMEDLQVMCGVLLAFKFVAFQPKLRDMLAPFGLSGRFTLAGRIFQHQWARCYALGKRNTINIITSALDGVTNTSTIASVFEAAQPVPCLKYARASGGMLEDDDTTPEEFARVLKLASLVSLDCVKTVVDATSNSSLVLIVAPAIQLLCTTTDYQLDKAAIVIAIADHVSTLLKQKMPSLRNMLYKRRHVGCSVLCLCGPCRRMQAFLESHDVQATFDKKVYDAHIKRRLEQKCLLKFFSVERLSEQERQGLLLGTWASVQSSNDASKTVVLTKVYESPLFLKAQQELVKLGELSVESVRVAVVGGNCAKRAQ